MADLTGAHFQLISEGVIVLNINQEVIKANKAAL
jgi:hypothetical protein